MKAFVLERPIRADEMRVKDVPIPAIKSGWVLVKIKAFGLNRSEIYTRQGDSPSVKLPRVIGIECVGEVADPGDSSLRQGQKVVSLMGGLGRRFDGSYAEYALIPAGQVYPLNIDLDWIKLAALPETYFTAYGSLFDSLQLKQENTLLVRGATSSVGVAAIQLAKNAGARVTATTRNVKKADILMQYGADEVIIDDDSICGKLLEKHPEGIDRILELVGTNTLLQSMGFLKKQGILCQTGILSGQWTLHDFEPLEDIPTGTYLTAFHSDTVTAEKVEDMFSMIEQAHMEAPISAVFSLDEIGKAHQYMESNSANGKIVVVNP